MWKNPPGWDSAPAAPLEPLEKRGKNPKKPDQPLQQLQDQARGCDGGGFSPDFLAPGEENSSIRAEHQHFSRGTGWEVVSSSALAALGLPGAQPWAGTEGSSRVQLLENRAQVSGELPGEGEENSVFSALLPNLGTGV